MAGHNEQLTRAKTEVGMDGVNNDKDGMKNGLGGQKDTNHLVVRKLLIILKIKINTKFAIFVLYLVDKLKDLFCPSLD